MYRNVFKRFLDFFLAIILLIVTLPVTLIVALFIKLEDGGPVIFRQLRSGKNKNFVMYKFRSMSVDNDVHDFKIADHVTRIGSFIRKTSIDELPQLLNIIKGDMSFIGPRPWIVDYSLYFTNRQRRRLDVLPGITGLAQCSGRNDISIKEKIEFDVYYVENISFLQDIKIIFKTFYFIFNQKGNNSDKNAIRNELDELKSQRDLRKCSHDVLESACIDENIEKRITA